MGELAGYMAGEWPGTRQTHIYNGRMTRYMCHRSTYGYPPKVAVHLLTYK